MLNRCSGDKTSVSAYKINHFSQSSWVCSVFESPWQLCLPGFVYNGPVCLLSAVVSQKSTQVKHYLQWLMLWDGVNLWSCRWQTALALAVFLSCVEEGARGVWPPEGSKAGKAITTRPKPPSLYSDGQSAAVADKDRCLGQVPGCGVRQAQTCKDFESQFKPRETLKRHF